MYKFWVQITLVTLVQLRLNAANHLKMYYVTVIILRGRLLFFPIKYNQNNMVEIDLCILRLLHWNVLVHYHR